MSGRAASYQGGSIVSFIIITVIIVAALGAGLYALRHRSEQTRISSTTSQDVPAELPGASDDADQDESERNDTEDSSVGPSGDRRSEDATTDETAENSTESTDEDTSAVGSTGGSGSSGSADSSSPTVAVLPETGPEQLAVIPIFAVVVYAALAYVGSSRRLAEVRS